MSSAKGNRGALARISRAELEPIWSRLDIPTQRIAAALGVTRAAISYRARVLGLPSRRNNHEPLKVCSDETFRRMWSAGVRAEDMAKVLGFASRSSVRDRRLQLGLPPRPHGGRRKMPSLSEFREKQMAEAMRRAA